MPGHSSASGNRSVAADGIYGQVFTGDNARSVTLAPGSLPDPAQVPAPAGLWNVPRRPSRVFVGRDKVMAAVAAGPSSVIGQSVSGLGGVGKTEVALHHAHDHRAHYAGVWWISADTPANLTGGLAALAHRLAPATTVVPDEQAEAWATAWLHHHDGWLLVLDNVESPDDVQALLSGVDGGTVLVTTRRDVDWAEHGLAAIRLDTLDEEDAVRLVAERTGYDDGEAAESIWLAPDDIPRDLITSLTSAIRRRRTSRWACSPPTA